MAAQFLRPDSNVTQTNFTNGFAQIDETSANDSDYAYGAEETVATLEVGLSNPSTTPDLNRTVTVRYRIAKVAPTGTVVNNGDPVDLTCYVYEGTTLRATDTTRVANGTWTTYSFTPDLSAVSNWNDLRLRFVTSMVNQRSAGISWAEIETDPVLTFNDTISESATPGDSDAAANTIAASFSESATPGDVFITASNANIHAFTRLPFGEIWFLVPTGTDASHSYFTFCVDESLRAQSPVWFKGAIDAAACLDDPQLGTDAPWSCLRVPEGADADMYSFDRRADGTTDVEWNLTSSAFYIDEAERRVLLKRYYKDFEQQDEDVTLQIQTYDFPAGSNIASPSLTVGTGDTTKDFRVSGRLMKMKFSGSGRCRLGKPAFDIVEMGER